MSSLYAEVPGRETGTHLPRIVHENQRCRPEFVALVDALRAEFTRAEITAIADYIESPNPDTIPAAAVTLLDALLLIFNEN